MPSARNVLFITLDQWRGDCLSALGHPVLETPTLDALAGRGVLFANHWANAAPCGPSRACLYTGTYQHRNRSVLNGTPLDARFTNVALLARGLGYDPVLFGYTDTSVDPRTVPPGDPRLFSYEGVLPGFRALIEDPWEKGSPAWGRWLAAQGFDVPVEPPRSVRAHGRLPGGGRPRVDLGPGPVPASCRRRPSSDAPWSSGWSTTATRRSSSTPPSSVRIHPDGTRSGTTTGTRPRRSGPSSGAPPPRRRGRSTRSAPSPWERPGSSAPRDERERRQLRATYYGAQREVDDGLAPLFEYLVRSGLAETTLVVVTSDHGEMGGDHWLLEKLGFWDESYHVPLIVVDPRPEADGARGSVVGAVTESVDVLPDDLRVHGSRGAPAGRRVVTRPIPARRAGPHPLEGHGPLRVVLFGPGAPAGREGVRNPDEPLCAGGVPWSSVQVRPVRGRCGGAAAAAVRPRSRPRTEA